MVITPLIRTVRLCSRGSVFVQKWFQSMPDARPDALVFTRLQLTARRGALRVDEAGDGLTDDAGERAAAWFGLSGARHARVPGTDLLDQ